MHTKRILVIAAVLLFANTSFAQSNRLRQLASQLTTEANTFAASTYSDYTRGFRNNRTDIQTVMAAHQFSAGAELFNRLVNDRRRTQELRDAFQMLQDSSRSANQGVSLRNRWNTIERLMSDITNELSIGDSTGPIPSPFPFPDGGSRGPGRMTWRGTIDDDVRIIIRGGTAQVETIGGSPYYDAVSNFTSSLPSRRVSVSVLKRRGRGEVFIEQQPSRENDYSAVIRVRDPRGGASEYEFDVSW